MSRIVSAISEKIWILLINADHFYWKIVKYIRIRIVRSTETYVR